MNHGIFNSNFVVFSDSRLSFKRMNLARNCYFQIIIRANSVVLPYFSKNLNYSKTCLKWPLKNKTKIVFKSDYRLMQVKSIAPSLQNAPLGAFCNTFDLY